MTTIKNTNNIEVDEFGNTVVATDQQVVNRKNISVDKTDVVLEDLCCPCGLCCCIQAWYCNPSGCLGCVLKQECCGCRWSGKCCKCMSPSKNDQKMCCLFQQTACSCHLPTTVSVLCFLISRFCYLLLLTFFFSLFLHHHSRFAISLINVVAFMLVWLFHATFFKAKFLYSLVVESVLFTPKLVVANANSNR